MKINILRISGQPFVFHFPAELFFWVAVDPGISATLLLIGHSAAQVIQFFLRRVGAGTFPGQGSAKIGRASCRERV